MKRIFYIFITTASLFAGGGDIFRYQFLVDQLEVDKNSEKSWDISFFAGFDKTKLYIYSEGTENESQNEAVISYAISPFWDIQAGVEIDKDEKKKAFAELALAGLAPYFIETRTKILAGNGAVGVDFDFEYETLFTQKLILNSRIESRIFSKDLPEIGVYSGLNSIEVGFRLRYEIKREFAPYVGYEYSRNFGSLKEEIGSSESRWVAGLRVWF